MKLSPAERQRRSDLAKELHRRGVLGGSGPARKSVEVRRAKSERVSELAQSMAARHAREIEAALVHALKHGSPGQRLRAAETMVKLGLSGERTDATERKSAVEHMDRAELIETLAAKLSGPSPAAAAVRARLAEQTIDSTAIEITDL